MEKLMCMQVLDLHLRDCLKNNTKNLSVNISASHFNQLVQIVKMFNLKSNLISDDTIVLSHSIERTYNKSKNTDDIIINYLNYKGSIY